MPLMAIDRSQHDFYDNFVDRLHEFPTDEEYQQKFHYNVSRWNTISSACLSIMRIGVLIFFFSIWAVLLISNDLVWFVEYETYWSFLFALIALIMAAKLGTKDVSDQWWFRYACIT